MHTSTFNFCNPILLPNNLPTSSKMSSGRTRHDILFTSLYVLICLHKTKLNRISHHLKRVSIGLNQELIIIHLYYGIGFNFLFSLTYLYIKYVIRLPNTRKISKTHIPYRMISSQSISL